jgi:hypothetical protein
LECLNDAQVDQLVAGRLTSLADQFKPIIAYLTNEDTHTSGSPLPSDEVDLDHWFLEDEQGLKREIVCPGIYYEDKEVFWRE